MSTFEKPAYSGEAATEEMIEEPSFDDVIQVFSLNAEAYEGQYVIQNVHRDVLDEQTVVSATAAIYNDKKELVRYVTYKSQSDIGKSPIIEYWAVDESGARGEKITTLVYGDGSFVSLDTQGIPESDAADTSGQ